MVPISSPVDPDFKVRRDRGEVADEGGDVEITTTKGALDVNVSDRVLSKNS
jgi:hypothetical protein